MFNTESTYTFHLFYTPLFNDTNITQRLNILRNKINKAQNLLTKMQNEDLVLKCSSFLNPSLLKEIGMGNTDQQFPVSL